MDNMEVKIADRHYVGDVTTKHASMPQKTCVPVSMKIAYTQNAHHISLAGVVSVFKIKYHKMQNCSTNKLHHSLHNAALQTRIDFLSFHSDFDRVRE